MKTRFFNIALIVIALVILCPGASAQNRKAQSKPVTVYGNVKSETGIPLMGVEISVQDSFIKGETDENGDFSVVVPGIGSVMVFNTMYYKEKYVQITSSDRIQVVMEEAPLGQGAKDKVNLPFRTSQKRNVTASIATIGSEAMDVSKVISLDNALAGRVAGLSVRQYSGYPGNDHATLRIRGVRTLYKSGDANALAVYAYTEPLVIVDGFERSFNELDANEVESFSILKDAAATAIYGLRGGNGVILVNTKRGETNKRKIEFKYNEGLVTPTDCLPDYVDAATYASWYNEARTNDGYNPVYTDEDIELYKNQKSPLTHPDNDYYDMFLKKMASQRKASLTMSGGNQIAKYFILLGYNFQNGLFKYSDFNDEFKTKTSFSKYNVRTNVDITPAKWLTISADIAGRIEERRNPYSAQGTIMTALHSPANAYPISFTGKDPNTLMDKFMLGGNSLYTDNPLGLLAFRGYNEDTRRYFQMTGRAKADLSSIVTPGLTFEISGHLDGYSSYNVAHSRNFSVWEYSKNKLGEDVYTSFVTESTLSASGSYDIERFYGLDAQLKYHKDFGASSFDAMGFYAQRLKEIRQNNQSDYRNQDMGLVLTYSLKNKYFLDFTADYGGSEKFYGTKHERELYPALGAAWIMSNENFMSGIKWIDYLKLRASFGLSGVGYFYFTDVNGDDERYPSIERWWMSSTWQYYGTSLTSVTTIAKGRMINPDCCVEKSALTNVALEGSMFNHRFNMDLEYWFDHRYDIYTAAVGIYPQVLGEEERKLPITNDGIVNNQGIEFTADWSDKIGDFSYGIGGNIAFQGSKIIEMGEPFREYDNLIQTGNPVRWDYGLKCKGLFKDQADIDNSPVQMFGTYQPGDLKYEDINGDNKIDANDYVPIGKGNEPKLNYGFFFNVGYKGLELDLLFHGIGQKSIWANINAMKAFTGNSSAQRFMEGRFHTLPDGSTNWETATYPRFSTQASDNNFRATDYWMYDASYLRLKNVELSYTLPSRLLKNVSLYKARVYLNAYNPVTFTQLTKYHLDPDDKEAGTESYPMIKIFSVGVDLTF